MIFDLLNEPTDTVTDTVMSEDSPTEDITPRTRYQMLPLRDVVVFPHMVLPLFVGREKSINALEEAVQSGKQILLAAQHDAADDDPAPENIFGIGTVANILQLLKLPDVAKFQWDWLITITTIKK